MVSFEMKNRDFSPRNGSGEKIEMVYSGQPLLGYLDRDRFYPSWRIVTRKSLKDFRINGGGPVPGMSLVGEGEEPMISPHLEHQLTWINFTCALDSLGPNMTHLNHFIYLMLLTWFSLM